MTISDLRNKLCDIAYQWVGVAKGDSNHKLLIDYYNEKVNPLPRGYKVKYSDSYCATAITAWFYMADMPNAIYPECGVYEMRDGASRNGIFNGNVKDRPSRGDLVLFSYSHVALVLDYADGKLHCISPNDDGKIIEKWYDHNNASIMGYIVPAYDKYVTDEPKQDNYLMFNGKKYKLTEV